MSQAATRLAAAACLAFPVATACASSGPAAGALEPRFVAVHNTLAAMGLVQVGPLHQGALAQGAEARAPLELGAGCTTIVAIGGEGLRDIDAHLLDAQGQPVAHDTTAEPQAVLRVCTEVPATYVLVVKAVAGAGSFVAAAWQGGAAATAPSAGPQTSARQALGTCEAPIPLSAGTVSGSTARGEDANTGSCERSDARELVYELDLTQRQRVVLDVEAHFDAMLYIRRDSCSDPEAEIDCNDDVPNGGHNRSRIERALDPGKYFVFVDGYNQESGAFKLTVSTGEPVSLGDVCRRAPQLVAAAPVSATTRGRSDDAEASCGGGAQGLDAPWRLELPSRARVRLSERSVDTSPVLHVRRACADERSETACAESGMVPGEAVVTGTFDPGAYTVFADAREAGAAGSYSLLYETVPPGGTGVTGDGCGDAQPLSGAGTVVGDTFAARDDLAGSCGGAGAPDVVYLIDVPRRSRLVLKLDGEEGAHVLVALRHCGDRASELACGKSIDEVVSPGTYFVAVDGESADALGRFTLIYSLQDLSAQVAACASAPALISGKTVSSSTAGIGDRFSSSCSGTGDNTTGTGPDRVFKFTLASRSTVRLNLVPQGFDATLAVRHVCSDTPAGFAELTCVSDPDGGRHTGMDATLDPGTYYAVVDGQGPGDQGPFTLEYRVLSAR